MNAKKLLIALLGLSTAATWGPQVWSAYQGADAPQQVYPDADEVGAGSGFASEAVTFASDSNRTAPVEQVNDDSVPVSASNAGNVGTAIPVEQLLSVLETFTGGPAQGISQLEGTSPDWVAGAEGNPGGNPDSRGLSRPSGFASAETKRAQAARVVESARLSAIVNSEKGSWALLDGRIVQVGDVLVPNHLWIDSIHRGSVTLMSPEGPIELRLPAFKASAPASSGIEPGLNDDATVAPQPPAPADMADSLELDPS